MTSVSASSAASTARRFADALPDLLERYGGRLHALALRLCGNAADAEDALQDALLQAHRKWHTFRGESDPATWLYTITVRACRRRLRERRRRTPTFQQAAPWNETTVSSFGLGGEAPAERAVRREEGESLRAAIAGLPAHFRAPIILKEMLEMSVEETAAALGVKPETIKTRLHRGRLLLRKALLKKARTEPAPAPIYDMIECAALLRAKLEAMDKGRGFPIGGDVICRRCRAVFRELDLVQEACASLGEAGVMPARLRAELERAVTAAEARSSGAVSRTAPRRSRPSRGRHGSRASG